MRWRREIRAKAKARNARAKEKCKKGVYGVDGYWNAEGDGGDPLTWAEKQWKGSGVENAGAVYDQDDV